MENTDGKYSKNSLHILVSGYPGKYITEEHMESAGLSCSRFLESLKTGLVHS